jgi:hypothetical protein
MGDLGLRFGRRRDEARLRRRLRRELADLDIEEPTGMAEVCRRLGARRGKSIRLVPYPLEVPGPFGLWLDTPSADYILYQAETTPLHQEHIVAHELGHVLARHRSDEPDDEVWGELMPDVPPEVVRRALRRNSYDTDQEREAETVATMLLEAAAARGVDTLPGRSPRARRVERALGDSRDWL